MNKDRVTSAITKLAPGARLAFDEPLSAMTSLRIGGPADVLVSVSDASAVPGIMLALEELEMSFMAMGGGTNMLIADTGLRGAVLYMASLDTIEQVDGAGSDVLLNIGAGLKMGRLMGYARREGLTGIEGLSGIPGYIGGAIWGNAGSFGTEIMDVIREVTLAMPDGTYRTLRRDEINPGYRQGGMPINSVVLSATIALRRDETATVAARMDEALRRKSDTQPLKERTAGCVFKNPAGDSAGRLIDEAGCKGMSEGAVQVSEIHAGFFINRGGATASDFIRLMEKVSKRVSDTFDITLEPEIKVVGSDA